uniref:Tyrosine-protein phosphatase domain-containing protein n=1 Tax=Panagrellus redivivus TaxID=6233 RepID=A0A7E4VID7_PANRE
MSRNQKKIFIPRKGSRTTASVSKGIPQAEVGERVADFITAVQKTNNPKARTAQFEQMSQWSRVTVDSIMANRDKTRSMIPILDKKRVKLSNKKSDKDTEFIQATYASFNREDYIITQSPTKDTIGEFWRMIWQDGCKLIVCVVEKDNIDAENDEKCYPYFPTKEDTPVTVLDGRYTIKLTKKWENKGFATYDLTLASTDEPEVKEKPPVDKDKDKDKAPDDDSKPRVVTLMHFTDWKENEWPDIDKLGPFIHAVSNKELHIIKRITDDYVPPVVLQGHLGLNRSAVVWVLLILMKQIERRDCFDVEVLARHVIRFRPGAFSNEMCFFVMFATAFRIAALGGWSTNDGSTKCLCDCFAL